MLKNLMMTMLLTVLLASGLTAQTSLAGEDVTVGKLLTEALADQPETVKIWVYFQDKGVSASGLAAALEQEKSTRLRNALQRRMLRRETPDLLGEADLPLAPRYLDQVTSLGATLRRTSRWLNAASFEATAAQVRAIARLDVVTRLDLVRAGRSEKPRLSATPSAEAEEILLAAQADKNLDVYTYGISYPGLTQINVPSAHAQGLSGQGVTVAILDTGFDLTHECLQHLDVVATWDFINDDEYVGNQQNDDPDQTLYGTAALSAIAGFSPSNLVSPAHQASVILAKTEDLSDETPVEEDNWIAALEWAESLGADIVSSGLGYYSWYDFIELDGQTTRITIAAEMAAARGVLMVNAVGDMRGNPDWPHILPPADGRNVLAVGSIDLYNQVSFFSASGPTADGRIKPEVMALGTSLPVALSRVSDMYYYGSGTNYSASLVSGVAALMLEQNPSLNPAQVREALRETASRAILPDNDYGWGTIDALQAINYWVPLIQHDPLPNVEPGGGSYRARAELTSQTGLDTDNLWVFWRRAGQSWNMIPLIHEGGDTYGATIGAQPPGMTIEYYISAQDLDGYSAQSPLNAPQQVHSFNVEEDQTSPVITHIALADQNTQTWQPTVIAEVTDNLGVADVSLQYNVQGGVWQGPFPMTEVDGRWEIPFPWPYPALPGAELSYIILARDTANSPNMAVGGPYEFDMVEHKGHVLLVDDRGLEKTGSSGRELQSPVVTQDEKNAGDLAEWLFEAGFKVDVIGAYEVTSSSFNGYDAVMVSCGRNFSPLVSNDLRQAMLNWSRAGGRLLVEGGEVAYAALENLGEGEWAQEVLHIDSYQGDDAASLRPPLEYMGHPLVLRPHALTVPFVVNNQNGNDWGACDMVSPTEDAQVIMQSGYGSRFGGVVVHDDNTGIDGGQFVLLPFNLLQVIEPDARAMLDNAMTYLLYREPDGPSSIAGQVLLAGQSDHSGVTISAGLGRETTTEADGSYTLAGLWGGRYFLTVSAEGYATQSLTLEIAEGENLPGVDFTLQPVLSVSYPDAADSPIPDNNPTGITRTVNVGQTGEILGVSVDMDISHYAIGQLTVELVSPAGTSVMLHNRTGGTVDNLVGNYPGTLFVDGPGALEDLVAENPAGAWTLQVSDHQFGATGQLNSWTLNLMISGAAATPASSIPLGRSGLLGNHPNPFNPRTEISFELSSPGLAQLDIYDVRGRLVRHLTRSQFPAGRHSLVWDGRDEKGAEPASGVYFCRFHSQQGTQVQKMMLVR